MITEAQDQEGPIPEEVVLLHAFEELGQVQVRMVLSELRTQQEMFSKSGECP